MLNVVNLLTAFKEKLVDQRDKILSILEPYINAIVDDELDLDVSWQPGGFEKMIDESKFQAYYTLFHTLVSKSFQLADGVVFGILEETITDDTHLTYVYKDGMHDNGEICRIIRASEDPEHPEEYAYFIGWNGWDVAHRSSLAENLKALYDGLLDAEAISTAAMTAIDLCTKGQLDPTNFNSTLSNMGTTARDAVKETVNIILANVSGKDAFEQAKGLILSFQQLYSGAMPGNITVDDDRINFHPINYSISSAILLPIEGIVSSVGTMIGMIVAAFGNPIGFVIAAAGSAISGLLNVAENVIGNDWNISPLHTLDNEACCLPIMRGTFYAVDLPQSFVSYTKKYGYLRCENSLYTTYSWVESINDEDHDLDLINVEMFFNVNVNINKKYNGNNNAMISAIINSISDTSFTAISKATCALAVESTFSEVGNLKSDWKVQFAPENVSSVQDAQNRFITYNLILQFAFFISRLFSVSSNYQDFIFSESLSLDWWRNQPSITEIDDFDLDDCKWYLGNFLYWVKYRLSNGTLDDWTDIEVQRPGIDSGDWAAYTSSLINVVYTGIMVMKRLMNNNGGIIKDIFTIFPTIISMGDVVTDSGDAVLGIKDKWSPAPCISYETDFLISPPKNRYNFSTRLVMTALVTVAIATVTAITTSQLKRRIAWKTMEKQKQLTKLRDKYLQSNSYADYNNLYKATKKYNMTYGFLTGTSFDMSNAWVNERMSTGIFASTSDVVPSLIASDENTGKAVLDLNPVIGLIKPLN